MRRPPTRHGEHSREIWRLAELRYSKEEMEALVRV